MEKSQKHISAYAVQCGDCFKWRLIPTKEEYEKIREKLIEEPWYCYNNPDVLCDDPGDIEYDSSRVWVIDNPNLPKTPPGTQRNLTMRSDFSKMDVKYVMPNGKKIRSCVEVEKFLQAFPEYKAKFSPADFSFTSPKISEMVPKDVEEKMSAIKNKKLKVAESST